MIKTLAKAQQQERVKFRVPRSVQDAIPIRRIWSDGIFLCGNIHPKHISCSCFMCRFPRRCPAARTK